MMKRQQSGSNHTFHAPGMGCLTLGVLIYVFLDIQTPLLQKHYALLLTYSKTNNIILLNIQLLFALRFDIFKENNLLTK